MRAVLARSARLALLAITCLAPSAAWATCLEFCEVHILQPDSCTAWTRVERGEVPLDGTPLRVTAHVGTRCCAPPSDDFPDGDCSTSIEPGTPALTGPAASGAWAPAEACGETPVMQWAGPLPGGDYRLVLAGCPYGDGELDFAVAGGDGGSTSGCALAPGRPGHSGGAAALIGLLLLGAIGRRRR